MTKTTICGNDWIQLKQTDYGDLTVWMDDGAVIVPLNENNEVLMISEPSIAYDGMRTLGLPAGGVEIGESAIESANRELQEEIGMKAERLDFLGSVCLSVKYIECKIHIFLARDLTESKIEGDEPEGWIEQQAPIGLDQIEQLILDGKLLSSPVISALLLARSFIARERLS